MRYFFISARSRGAPTRGPNSPRETGVGVDEPRATKPEIPSKSNVRQTMCFATAHTRRNGSNDYSSALLSDGKHAARRFAIIRLSFSSQRLALKIMPEHLVQNWQVRKPLARLRANFYGNI